MSYDFLAYWAFIIYILSVIMYVCLDGFGLGLGCLHIFARTDRERRVFLNAVGPVWDGNAVWIVIVTGILLAAFSKVFTSLLSGFYLPMMGLIFGFMVRSAAIEFRSKRDGKLWRNIWDYVFFLTSVGMALDFGMILGHTIQGVPIEKNGMLDPHAYPFFTAYPVAVGVMTTLLFALHGATYVMNKVESETLDHMRKRALFLYPFFVCAWIITTGMTLFVQKHMLSVFETYPVFLLFALLFIGAIILLPLSLYQRKPSAAFFSSATLLTSLVLLYAVGMQGVFAHSSLNPLFSLTIENSANSYLSLFVVFVVSVCGLPLSFFYFSYIYKVFKGKVTIDTSSY